MVYTSVWFLFASTFCCCHLLIGNLWQVAVVNQGKCICQLTVSVPVPECYISCTPRSPHSLPPLNLPLFYSLLSAICHSVASPYLGGFRGKRPCGNAASVCDMSKWQTGTDAASISVCRGAYDSLSGEVNCACVCVCVSVWGGMQRHVG